MYHLLFTAFLRHLEPERAHHLAMLVIRALPVTGAGWLLSKTAKPAPELAVSALGLTFPTPFGVAAGFDKEAIGVLGLGQLGFGHVEIGTVTAQAQPGNERPRLFRLLADKALINRMGFNNHGAAAVAPRLEKLRRRRTRPVIGVNIGKSRVVAVEDAVADYVTSATMLAPLADYLAVNVSSPNTPGLRGLQELEQLSPLLAAIKKVSGSTPLLVKIAPDLTDDEVLTIARLVLDLELDGIIATNTTISREGLRTAPEIVEAAGAGGVSGPPVKQRSLEILDLLRSVLPEEVCVISVGGVDTGADVAERLARGATLVQGYTRFLYSGPFWARRINRELVGKQLSKV